MTVHVLPKWATSPYLGPDIQTTLNHGLYRDLSPFVLGPVKTYTGAYSANFENLWQFSKVYREHLDGNGNIKQSWMEWRRRGWNDHRARRYPMGKGRKPEFSLWDGERLGYIDARKRIYARLYAATVVTTQSYLTLELAYGNANEITLRDYDAYDHISMGMSLKDVINNPDRKMGHAFVLAMLLEGVLEECLE